MIKARLLCESALERVMAYLRFAYDGTDGEDFYPATETANHGYFTPGIGGWAGHYYMVSEQTSPNDDAGLEEAMSCYLGFDYTPNNDPDPTANASWQHIRNSDGTELIGRIAFLVIDESGKIDPAGAVNPNEPYLDENRSETRDAGEPFNDWDNDGSFDNAPFPAGEGDEGDESVWGFDATEINLGNADDDSDSDPTMLFTNVDPNLFKTEMHTNAERWFSWRQIYSALGLSETEAQSLSKVIFPHSYEDETYWNGAAVANRTELRNYPTGGTDWNTATIADIQDDIPWLTEMVDSGGSSVSDQVTANLIDYCDTDSSVTTDFQIIDPTVTVTYMGLEKTPYINEVLFTTHVDTINSELDVVVEVELANIYDEELLGNILRVDYDIAADEISGGPLSQTVTLHSDGGTNTVSNNSYAVYDQDSGGAIPTVTVSLSGATLTDCTITNVRVFMYSAAPLNHFSIKDYAEVGDSDPFSGLDTAHTFEVKDPRHNLPSSEWTYTAGSGTEGSKNAGVNPSTAGGDTETVTDPVDGMSTAYIRDDEMLSLWELGAIHRGEAYRTINLQGYNDGSDLVTAPASYTNGDAAILDQVKINPYPHAIGRINANTPVAGVWAALLSQVYIGCPYEDNDTSSATELYSTGQVSSIALALANHCATPNSSFSRAHVADVATLFTGAGQSNDAEEEEIIGKMAQLLTTRQNFFRVIVTAQVVKDMGAAPASVQAETNVVTYDGGTNFCRILAEQKMMAIVYRDAFMNTYKVISLEYLED
jgi:hypothetical protein